MDRGTMDDRRGVCVGGAKDGKPTGHLVYASDLKRELLRDDIDTVFVYDDDGTRCEYRKAKHGQWKYNIIFGWCYVGTEATSDYVCSVCGWHTEMLTDYCPSCGAIMDEENE